MKLSADLIRPAVSRVLGEVLAERVRQHEKWGEQNHPDGTSWDAWVIQRDLAKADCDAAAKVGECTYVHILREEVLEAFAETDPAKLRAELVQIAAVAVQWVEAIDRRARHDAAPLLPVVVDLARGLGSADRKALLLNVAAMETGTPECPGCSRRWSDCTCREAA